MYLTSYPGDCQNDSASQQQRRQAVDAPLQQGRNASHRLRIASDEGDKWIVKGKQEQQAIKRVIDGREIAILLFVENHEAIMLLYEVVVGPKRGNEEEDKASAEKDHEWANYEEKQRPPEQTSPIPALSPIEIGARECAEDVWRINQYCPECNHRNERYYSASVKNEKGVAGSYRTDEPD